MKKIKTFVVMMVVAVLGLTTSFDASATTSSFYDAKACKTVANKKSPCNQGAEPFYVFIKKFKTNKKFAKSRVKMCNNKQCKDFCQYALARVINGEENFFHGFETFRLKKEWIKNENLEEGGFYEDTTATWSEVSKNKVVYMFDGEGEYGWGFTYTFERIKGKWYMTHYINLNI